MGRRILRISKQFLTQIWETGEQHYIVEQGLPSDARIVSISMHLFFCTNDIAVLVESSHWPEVPDGHVVPEIIMSFRSIHAVEVPKGVSRPSDEWTEVATANKDLWAGFDQSIEEAVEFVAKRNDGTLEAFIKCREAAALAKQQEAKKQEPPSSPIRFREFT